ncbi:hypothetical protein CTM67_06600 [Photobacterium phosphoreum]|nr:hypothetical protein CTM67_06600 [Photobacterium phosphoreum]
MRFEANKGMTVDDTIDGAVDGAVVANRVRRSSGSCMTAIKAKTPMMITLFHPRRVNRILWRSYAHLSIQIKIALPLLTTIANLIYCLIVMIKSIEGKQESRKAGKQEDYAEF